MIKVISSLLLCLLINGCAHTKPQTPFDCGENHAPVAVIEVTK